MDVMKRMKDLMKEQKAENREWKNFLISKIIQYLLTINDRLIFPVMAA